MTEVLQFYSAANLRDSHASMRVKIGNKSFVEMAVLDIISKNF